MIWSTVAAASSSLLLRTATVAYHRRPSPAIWSLAIAASSWGEKIEVSGRVPRTRTAATTSFRRRSSSSSRAMGDSGFGRFPLSQNSVLCIEKGDITAWFVNGTSDAIVNAANEKMLGGGGVDGAIHWAAGPELRAACLKSPEVRPGVRCPTGEARITPAFRLPVAHVIHTVGPIYRKDAHSEVFLRKSYRSCLTLAKANGIDHIAFPAISCGVFGYPYEEASTVAISTVKEFANDFKEVHFVLFSDDIHQIWLDSARKLL